MNETTLGDIRDAVETTKELRPLRLRTLLDAPSKQQDDQVVQTPLIALRLLTELLVKIGRQPHMDVYDWLHGPSIFQSGISPMYGLYWD